jgi:hypothetical protein
MEGGMVVLAKTWSVLVEDIFGVDGADKLFLLCKTWPQVSPKTVDLSLIFFLLDAQPSWSRVRR